MKRLSALLIACGLILGTFSACGKKNETSKSGSAETTAAAVSETSAADDASADAVTEEDTAEQPTEHATAAQNEVGYEGMEAVGAEALKDGEYHISVDSSSSMFKIADCILYVENGSMSADIIIASKSYDALFMGTEDEAAASADDERITYTEDESGQSVFRVPVEALDKEIQCAALSAKKQEWYGRTLVFRADSLPDEAFNEERHTGFSELGLEDGEYTIEVTLSGGSGRASVESPAKLTVDGGNATAEIVWSSSNYDYMIVGDEKYLPVNTEGNSVFEIPVLIVDDDMTVYADTTAMSTPHEIEYTLRFDSASVQ